MCSPTRNQQGDSLPGEVQVCSFQCRTIQEIYLRPAQSHEGCQEKILEPAGVLRQ